MQYCIPYLSNVAISAFEMKKRCKRLFTRINIIKRKGRDGKH